MSFIKNHGDTIAIIGSTVGVNIALGAILIGLYISNSSRIDACMTRIDGMYAVLMNNAGLAIPNHCKGFRPYEDVMPESKSWMIKDTKQGE